MAGSGPGTSQKTFEDVACPFCGMMCDDLTITRDAGGLKVGKEGCGRAVAGFERKLPPAHPQINGRDVSLNDAIAEAARHLKAAKTPIISGLATDVAGARAAMALADRSGAVIDHALSDVIYRNLRVLQSSGWVLTTLTEARNRADLFVVIGTDIQKLHPRFFEKIVNPAETMFEGFGQKRTVIFLGDNLDQSQAKGARVSDVLSLNCKSERLGEVFSALRALAKGAPLTANSIGGLPRQTIEDLLARIRNANYGVLVWAPSSFDFAGADLTVQAISEFAKEMNNTSRVAGLSLGGGEGAPTVTAVCTWQSGFPLRVSFASGKPHYDSERYSTSAMLAAHEADLLVWVASYSPDLSPPETDVPTIVLGTPGIKLKTMPAVFIPIGTPGVDNSGFAVRVDNVVTLPLKNLGRANLPSAAEVMSQIEAAL